ncbi:MAG: hypothetical protein ACO3A2_03575 [Bdellovibrionia bacterium]
MIFWFIFLSVVGGSAPVWALNDSHPPIPWRCEPSEWLAPATLEDGIFVANLSMNCVVDVSSDSVIEQMHLGIRSLLMKERILHEGPKPVEVEGISGYSYDTTIKLKEGQDELSIREDVILANQKNRIIYRTRSRDIQAPGLASYLSQVSFGADIRRKTQDPRLQIALTNRVEVKRPWYALAPIFFVIAKNTSISKFNEARDQLMTKLIRFLSQTQPGNVSTGFQGTSG